MELDQLLNEFATIIDLCREEVSKITSVQKEETFYYVILRTYSRVLLSCCEIYTLLTAMYPHGAMSLSRQVYEGLVIIDVLLQAKNNQDEEMVKKYFDSVDIAELDY